MPGVFSPKSTVDAVNMKMPVVGLGTWQATDKETEVAISAAIDAGYRHIDTAYVYMNEAGIGNALEKIMASGEVKREDLFIVTKLPSFANRPEYVETYLKKSLTALKLMYVDLYLIHSPVGFVHTDNIGSLANYTLDYDTDLLKLWKAMEKQVDAGRAKAIGVSNFNLKQVQRIVENCRIKPANNQVELHIYLQQKELVQYCKKNGVTVCAYAPLGSPSLSSFTKQIGLSTEGMDVLKPMEDPVVCEIAKKHGKSPSQVLLRFMVESGVAVIPKSTNPERIKQNFEIFDFELTSDEHQRLVELDKGPAGRMFNKGFFATLKSHPEYPFEN
ncbi:1,5-anhydro-D-fructose reductase-like [Cimex lectularius]|uniref:NADP-dependent oxidoreductase domain-containing protein n=1 Tax=Cimex lectularius TaxID=79782 RepID=A0A8I6S0T5_CIMLE|nr:1,5-anhydro-D-fructose reductase-like [Cimex lectularius]